MDGEEESIIGKEKRREMKRRPVKFGNFSPTSFHYTAYFPRLSNRKLRGNLLSNQWQQSLTTIPSRASSNWQPFNAQALAFLTCAVT